MGMKQRIEPTTGAKYTLRVYYPTDKHDWGSIDLQLEKAVGRPSDSSGTTFRTNLRDLGWDVVSRQAGFRAAKRIRALKLKHLKVELFNHLTKKRVRISMAVRAPKQTWWRRFCIWMRWVKPTIPKARLSDNTEDWNG